MSITQNDYENLIKFDFFINKDFNNYHNNILFGIEEFFGFSLTVYTYFNKDSKGEIYVENIVSNNVSDEGLTRYKQQIFKDDLFVQQINRNRHDALYKNLVKISDLDCSETFYESDYGKYLKDINTPYQVVLRSTRSRCYPSHVLCVFKTGEEGDFTEYELELLERIGDLFDRSVELYEKHYINIQYQKFMYEITSFFEYDLAILDKKENLIFKSEGFEKRMTECFGVQTDHIYISEIKKNLYTHSDKSFRQLLTCEEFRIQNYKISMWPYSCCAGCYKEKFYFIFIHSNNSSKLFAKMKQNVTVEGGDINKWKFTAREVEVVQCIMNGKNNDEISELLCINNSTVKFHIQNIYRKLNVDNRNSAIIKLISD